MPRTTLHCWTQKNITFGGVVTTFHSEGHTRALLKRGGYEGGCWSGGYFPQDPVDEYTARWQNHVFRLGKNGKHSIWR